MPQPQRPSLSTIAKALGLSVATVSNVYNHPEKVSEGVRRRVLDHARRVGWAGPDPSGRQLRRGRTDTVGLVFTDELPFAFRDEASTTFLAGLAEACAAAGQSLLLTPAGPPLGDDTAHAPSAAVDGVVVYSVPEDDPTVRAVLARRLPTVVVDQPGPIDGVDWVGLDDEGASRSLGRLVGGLGHRRIGILTSRLARSRHDGHADRAAVARATYTVMSRRIEGFLAGLADVGIGPEGVDVEERYATTRESGAAGLAALLARAPDLTAVCAMADVLALGALDAAARIGLDVPRDLTVTGYDDVPSARRAGLTTVRQSFEDKGRTAGELLLARIAARRERATPAPAARRILDTELVVRATSAPSARGGRAE